MKILASLCSWAGWFECYPVANFRRHIFAWRGSNNLNPILISALLSHLFYRSISIWAPSSEFVSSSILSWNILTVHAQPFRGARDLAFCLKVPLDSLLVWASSGGSGETARMRRLAWTFAARIGDKYQIRLTLPILWFSQFSIYVNQDIFALSNFRGNSWLVPICEIFSLTN